uniref:TH1 domain-containing protein n=1 Tax=Palpitomonas bilix TaxID=652834 RepID=A0A7S3DIN3_9EUKA
MEAGGRDYKAVAKSPILKRLLERNGAKRETILLSCSVHKISHNDKRQKRIFVLTNNAFYLITKENTFKRRTPLEDIDSVSFSSSSSQLIVYVPNEHDLLLDGGGKKDEIVNDLRRAAEGKTGQKLQAKMINSSNLRDFVRNQKGKAAHAFYVGRARAKTRAEVVKAVIDRDQFSLPSFESRSYIEQCMRTLTEHDFKRRVVELQDVKKGLSMELQKRVIEHYEEFIRTSKEIRGMEQDLIRLRSCLSDFQGVLKSMKEYRVQNSKQMDAMLASTSMEAERGDTNFLEVYEGAQELLEDMEVAVLERRYGDAVERGKEALAKATAIPEDDELLGEGNSPNAPSSRDKAILVGKIEDAIAVLTLKISEDLQQRTVSKKDVQRLVGYLIKLGRSEDARSIFLQLKSRDIESMLRRLQFHGDVTVLVGKTANILFGGINAVTTDFNAMFEAVGGLSSLVSWAGKLMEDVLGRTFESHVFPTMNVKDIGACVKSALLQCKGLEGLGLTLSFMLKNLINKNMEEVFSVYFDRLLADIDSDLQTENWASGDVLVPWKGKDNREREGERREERVGKNEYAQHIRDGQSESIAVKLTASAKKVYDSLQFFIRDVRDIELQVYSPIVEGVIRLVSTYSEHMVERVHVQADTFTDKQFLSAIANAYFLRYYLYEHLRLQLRVVFKREVVEFDRMKRGLTQANERLLDVFCKRRAEAAVKDKLKWSSFDRFPYSDSSLPLSDEVMPTHAFQQLVVLLAKLATAVKASISAQACVQVVSSVIEEIGMQMLDEEVFWSSSHGGGSVDDGFGEGGVQQFVLDVRFMLAACAG